MVAETTNSQLKTTVNSVAKKRASKKVTKTVAKKTSGSVSPSDFAVIETGGKQYIVSVGDVIDVELLKGELNVGDEVIFDKVLLSDNGEDATIGTPYIDGTKVVGTYRGVKKGKKLSIIRFKAKSNRSRKVGYRQTHAQVEITKLA